MGKACCRDDYSPGLFRDCHPVHTNASVLGFRLDLAKFDLIRVLLFLGKLFELAFSMFDADDTADLTVLATTVTAFLTTLTTALAAFLIH